MTCQYDCKCERKLDATYLADRLGGEKEGVTLDVSVGVDHCDGSKKMLVKEGKEGRLQKVNCLLGEQLTLMEGDGLEGKLHHLDPFQMG